MEKFIKRENYQDYGITVDSNRYRFVYHTERNGGHIELLDFVIDINKHVEHYKQYYKKVLEFINEFDFDKQNISANKEETKTKNEDAEPLNDMDNQYPSNDNSSTESKLEVPEPSVETIRSQTKEIIIDKINLIDKSKHWRYVFKTEKDFILYTELLTKFFEYKEYELPKVTMILRARCKTRLANTLGEIHLELSNRDTLAGDTKYFEIIRTLKPFKKSTNTSLYKDLTRFSRD